MRFDPDAPLWSRAITLGAYWGTFFGVFDVLILAAAVFGGRYQSCGQSPGSGTCDFWLLAVTYPIGAVVMGAAWPLYRRLWLAMPITVIAMIPWFLAIVATDIQARTHWAWTDTILVLLPSVALGGPVGYMIWKKRRDREKALSGQRAPRVRS